MSKMAHAAAVETKRAHAGKEVKAPPELKGLKSKIGRNVNAAGMKKGAY